MTANYFMLIKDGLAGIDCPPLPSLKVVGSTWGLSDVEFTDTFASGLGAWTTTDASVVSGRLRLAPAINGQVTAYRDFTQGWDDVTVTAEVAPTAINGAQSLIVEAAWATSGSGAIVSISVEGGRLLATIVEAFGFGGTIDIGAYSPTAHRWWRFAEKDGSFTFSTSPDGTTWTARTTITHGFPGTPVGGGTAYVAAESDGSTALEVFIDNVSVRLRDGVVGSATDPANYPLTGKDNLTTYRDAHVAAQAPMRYIPVTGFHGSGFKAVRTPGVADDSANSIAQQIYDHGWKLGYDLIRSEPITWPPKSNLAVVPVTGTPVMDDGQGVYAFTTVTRAAGTGTIRHILSGAGGSTRQIANILDLLAVSPSLLSSAAGTAAAGSPQAMSFFGAAFWHRAAIAGRAAVSLLFPYGLATTVPVLQSALGLGMTALTAKEHGLIGSGTLFTTAEYNAATAPLRAIIALPPGY
jgi:hypothetical protein